MSWGERSCVHIAVWPGFCEESHCNVDCAHYEHDGITAPDSKPARRKDAVDDQFTSTNKPIAAQGLNRAQRRAQAKKSIRLRNW